MQTSLQFYHSTQKKDVEILNLHSLSSSANTLYTSGFGGGFVKSKPTHIQVLIRFAWKGNMQRLVLNFTWTNVTIELKILEFLQN